MALTETHGYKNSVIHKIKFFSENTSPEIGNRNDEYKVVRGNLIHKTAVVAWDKIKIGTGNIIGPFACIGTEAQHRGKKSMGCVVIGDENIFREHSTVHLPTTSRSNTTIGNNNYLMVNAHVAHDCFVEDQVTLCNNVAIGGHVHVMKGAVLSLNASIHQYQVIGSYSMVGMNTCVARTADILPGYTYLGVPAKKIGLNRVGLRRAGATDAEMKLEFKRFSEIKASIKH